MKYCLLKLKANHNFRSVPLTLTVAFTRGQAVASRWAEYLRQTINTRLQTRPIQ